MLIGVGARARTKSRTCTGRFNHLRRADLLLPAGSGLCGADGLVSVGDVALCLDAKCFSTPVWNHVKTCLEPCAEGDGDGDDASAGTAASSLQAGSGDLLLVLDLPSEERREIPAAICHLLANLDVNA